MKKLLLSTALVGVVLSTSAIAQTTIGGNMTVGFRALKETGAAGAVTTNSKQGMLMETQINVASKGKLNNGMDYAAGFSLELDASDVAGTATSFKSMANENVYIDLISGSTTFSAGIDHMNDFDRSMIPVVGEIGKSTGSQGGATAKTNMLADPIGTSNAAGVAVRQAFPGLGQITLAYAPTMSCSKTQPAGCGGNDTTPLEGPEGSGYSALLELSNVGISGLALEAGIVTQKKKVGSELTSTRDGQFMTAGVKYTTGAVTLGYNRKEYEYGGDAAAVDSFATANETRKQNDYGIAYTAGNVSYGAIYQVTSSNIASELDEKYKSVAVGYNLGAIAAKVNLGRHTDVGGVAGTDVDSLTLKLSTNF
ncbi:MAG: hypothetical protein CK535_06045 [Pelagibacteraceae bacterium]|nr:MAG: hypothetical protein CK535_06045 [Pelagibacteraceae bacterium]